MDSNVSKKTFLHKFFKLAFSKQENSLSIKELLRQTLLSSLHLSQQRSNFSLDVSFISDSIGSKIALLHPSIESISSSRQDRRVLLTPQSYPIVYSCSIALLLASLSHKEPQVAAEELINLLIYPENNLNFQLNLDLSVEITKSGLIYFYLHSNSVAIWLNESLVLVEKTNRLNASNSLLLKSLDSSPQNLFPAQYVHARCCTLLLLGAKKNSLKLEEISSFVSWIDGSDDLLLKEEIELVLLRQLFLVTDSFAVDSTNWHKLALKLSATTVVFLAECRFIGEDRSKAIARLGLMSLTQYWLKRILVEKLNVVAPTNL